MADRRALLAMLVVGAVVAGGIELASPRVVVVHLSDDVSVRTAEVEALLLDEAGRRGWVRADPVVTRHLVATLRKLGRDGSDADLLDEALTIGLHHESPVVRARLLDRMRAALGGEDPGDATLEAHLLEHAERFGSPETYQVAVEVDGRVAPARWLTRDHLATLHGGQVADALVAEGWTLPVRTVRGSVRVRVDAVRAGHTPALAETRDRVLQDWRRTHPERLARAVADLSEGVRFEHRSAPGTP
jgi:hypothetical protein